MAGVCLHHHPPDRWDPDPWFLYQENVRLFLTLISQEDVWLFQGEMTWNAPSSSSEVNWVSAPSSSWTRRLV